MNLARHSEEDVRISISIDQPQVHIGLHSREVRRKRLEVHPSCSKSPFLVKLEIDNDILVQEIAVS